MEPVAYGPCGLTPAVFADHTPREFAAVARARQDECWRLHELVGWAVWRLRALWRKQPEMLDSLLGPAYTAWRLQRDAEHTKLPREADRG